MLRPLAPPTLPPLLAARGPGRGHCEVFGLKVRPGFADSKKKKILLVAELQTVVNMHF